MPDVKEISVKLIDPSPYQSRKKLKNLQSLAESIKDDSLIHPILVRPQNDRYEIVAGERRWRATKLAGEEKIAAIVRDLTDSQARRASYAENVQRVDLSPIEETEAWLGHLDAQMWKDSEYRRYAELNGWPDEKDDEQGQLRARWLLDKLDSDRRNDTDHFTHKFVGKVESIFSKHNRGVGWRSFLNHDIPLLDLPPKVKEIAVEEELNKSQSKALGSVADEDSDEAQEVLETGQVTVQEDQDFLEVPVREASSREIKDAPSLKRWKDRREEKEQLAGDKSSESPPRWIGEWEINSVYVGMIEEVREDLPPDTFDLIFTDPPYAESKLPLYRELALLGQKSLKPGGYCITYCGKMYLPQILSHFENRLNYIWTFSVFHPFSQQSIQRYKIWENWRPVVLLRKGEGAVEHDWIQDVIRGKREKDHHEWQQDRQTPQELIPIFCKEDGLVLDPFVGGGTIPYVCREVDRNFLAFDKRAKNVEATIGRLRDEQTEI